MDETSLASLDFSGQLICKTAQSQALPKWTLRGHSVFGKAVSIVARRLSRARAPEEGAGLAADRVSCSLFPSTSRSPDGHRTFGI